MRPKWDCIYGRCKMVNLCKGSHCVGAALDADGYKVDGFGNIVEKTEFDRPPSPQATAEPSDG